MIFLGCRATGRGNAIPGPNSVAPGVELELLDFFFCGGFMFGAEILISSLPGLEPVLLLLLLTDNSSSESSNSETWSRFLHVPWANGA